MVAQLRPGESWRSSRSGAGAVTRAGGSFSARTVAGLTMPLRRQASRCRSARAAAAREWVTSRQAAPLRAHLLGEAAPSRARRWPDRGCRSARRRGSAAGRCTSARAIATRCSWPPESVCGRRAAKPARPTAASTSRHARRRRRCPAAAAAGRRWRRRSGAAGRGRPGTRSRGRARRSSACAALVEVRGRRCRRCARVPASMRVEPGDAVEEGRLADARFADDGDELAGVEREVDAGEDGGRRRSAWRAIRSRAGPCRSACGRRLGRAAPVAPQRARAHARRTRSSASAASQATRLPPRHRAQPGQLALGELARRGAAARLQARRGRRGRAPPRPGGSRPRASTAAPGRGRRARAGARTSSTKPAAEHRREARVDARVQPAAVGRLERDQRRRFGARRAAAGCHAESGRPLTRWTSSARWMRCASFGASRAAVAGSTRASSACSAGQPSRAARASSSARTPGSAAGIASRPSNSALK